MEANTGEELTYEITAAVGGGTFFPASGSITLLGTAGTFVSQYAPAIKEGSGMENYIHIHLVSKTSKAAGHIDDIILAEGMVLRLPRP